MIPAGQEGDLRTRLCQAPSHIGPYRPCPKNSNAHVTPPRSRWPTQTAIEYSTGVHRDGDRKIPLEATPASSLAATYFGPRGNCREGTSWLCLSHKGPFLRDLAVRGGTNGRYRGESGRTVQPHAQAECDTLSAACTTLRSQDTRRPRTPLAGHRLRLALARWTG